jgi:hypothetical protein
MSKARFIETANYIYPSTSCLPNIVFEQAVVGASLDAYHYSYRSHFVIHARNHPHCPAAEGSPKGGVAGDNNINYNRKFLSVLGGTEPTPVQQSPAPSCSECGQDAPMAALMASRRFVSATKRGGAVRSCLLLALAILPTDAQTAAIETEHLFGFTIGSDVGEVGEREIEGSVTADLRSKTGSYNAASSTLSAEFVPLPNLRTEFTGVVVSYDIAGVSGLADQRYTSFGGLSADIRYRVLDRATAPVGFAIGAEPHWGRADDVTGEPVSQYGVDFVAAAAGRSFPIASLRRLIWTLT